MKVISIQSFKDKDKITIENILNETLKCVDELENIIMIHEYKDGKILMSWSKGLGPREIVGNIEMMKQDMIDALRSHN